MNVLFKSIQEQSEEAHLGDEKITVQLLSDKLAKAKFVFFHLSMFIRDRHYIFDLHWLLSPI